jgi:hypothetical protein
MKKQNQHKQSLDKKMVQNWLVRQKSNDELENELKVFEHFEDVRAANRSGIEKVTTREDYQNRYDRRVTPDGKVRIRIYISGPERALAPDVAAPYFAGLREHLRASGTVRENIDELFDGNCEFIVIECFGTEGLVGDEESSEKSEGNHFWHFFRAIGVSGNSRGSGRGGSHGLGRTVYHYLSKIHAIFGLSIRQHPDPERRGVLLGQCLMKYHSLNGQRFANIGYFGIDGALMSKPTLPIKVIDVLDLFSSVFNLKRQTGSPDDASLETGLSVVIPYAKHLDGDEMAFHAITEYGGLIVDGKLEVEIDAPGDDSLVIDARSIWSILESHANDSEWNETKHLLQLLQHGKNVPRSQWFDLPKVTSGQKLAELELPDELSRQLASSLDTGQVVVAKVPVELVLGHPARTEISEFRVVLQATREEKKISTTYFRDAIRVSGMESPISGFRSVFIADNAGNRTLADMLREAEGPSHTRWTHNDKLQDQHLEDASNWLKVCCGYSKKLVEQITSSHREEDFSTLAEFFPDPSWSGDGGTGSGEQPDGRGGEIRKKKRGGGGGGGGQRRPFEICVAPGGDLLEVVSNENALPSNRFTISLVYKLGEGNSFGEENMKLCPLSRLQFIENGVEIIDRDDSRVVVKTNQAAWSLGVKNLDKNRMPRIQVEV